MNPKLKAVFISLLFFPLTIIVATFCNVIANTFFQIFGLYYFSYYMGLINALISGVIASFFVLKLSKDNKYFYHLILLPVIGTIALSAFSFLFTRFVDSLSLVVLENFIILFSYVYLIKNNKSIGDFLPEKKIGRLKVLLSISWLIISIFYVVLSGNRSFESAITWGSIDWSEANTIKLILLPLVFILILPLLNKLKDIAFILIASFFKRFNGYFKGLTSLKFIGWIIVVLLIAITFKLYS